MGIPACPPPAAGRFRSQGRHLGDDGGPQPRAVHREKAGGGPGPGLGGAVPRARPRGRRVSFGAGAGGRKPLPGHPRKARRHPSGNRSD